MQTFTFEQFRASMQEPAPPPGLPPMAEALWYDGKGDWEKAHDIAQTRNTPPYCQLHAYLHRKEGDPSNARYWYNRAGKSMPNVPLAQEWEDLVREWL